MSKPRCLVALVSAFLLGTGLPFAAAARDKAAARLKQNLDLPFQAAAAYAEEEKDAPEIIVFYGQQFEGDGFFFSCDRSGTMTEGTKWKRLQQEVVKNITQFSGRVQFGIVLFDASVVKFPRSGRPAEATPAMKAAGIAMVMAIQPGSGTCTKPALLACLDFAHQSSVKRKLIIHLSDGVQTCPGTADETQYGEECLAEVRRKNTARTPINSICIGAPGQSLDEEWMRRLAAENGGSYTRIVQ